MGKIYGEYFQNTGLIIIGTNIGHNETKLFLYGKVAKNSFIKDKYASVKNVKEFWQNMKPLVSNNIREENNDIVLLNDNVIVNGQHDLLNHYFFSVTKDIGECDRIQETDKFTDKYSHNA